MTAAFPYVNSPLHIGHLRTYTTADILARYKRMRGYNVLFPMAMHGTGTPVLAFAKRLKENDQELIEELKRFHVGEEDIKKMTDPQYIIDYFVKVVERDARIAGFGIDWRRKFVSTEPFFGKFVEWQFGILHKKGYLTQGKHPVGWCPNEKNAVGMHDTKHDVEPEIEEETAVKFAVENEKASMLCSTYRPETIFGVTNIFAKQDAVYVLCKIAGENYYLSKKAAEALSYQMQIQITKEVNGSELLTKRCINPITKEVLPVLPGFFVKEEVGTGIVMSVPAHAPFDYAALERLGASGYKMPEIKPKKVIEVEIGKTLGDVAAGEAKPIHLDIPALAYLEILNTNANAIDDMLEFATKLQYREESHWGIMLVDEYRGMGEPEAREKVRERLLEEKKAISIYVLQNAPVVCRCGYNVVVRVVDNQWFINYGNKDWKAMVKGWLKQMHLLPEKVRNGFETAADWIDLRAVARAQGLGTRFPLDRNFIIESLSDSTIYPAFYTISHLIRTVPVEKLKPEFFDFVFLGKGSADQAAKATGIDYDVAKKCRESFTYWYRFTSRHSGPDLIFNHYTMYIYNHVAVFDREYWPKQIVVNGFVTLEGEKMSKSLGNIMPLSDGVAQAGADPARIVEAVGADLFSDSEYSMQAIRGVRERFEYLNEITERMGEYESGELKHADYWLYSRLNRKIEDATNSMEKMELRGVGTAVFYDSIKELKDYFEMGGENGIVIKDFVQSVVLMLQPIAPYVAEELWHKLGNTTLIPTEKWPTANKEMMSDAVEMEKEFVDTLVVDIKNVVGLMARKGNKKAKKVLLIVASDWKRELNNDLARTRNVQEVMKSVTGSKRINPEAAAKYVTNLAKDMSRLSEIKLAQQREFDMLSEVKEYLEKSVGAEVAIEKEEQSKSTRAGRAMPLKPSIDIES